MPWANHLEFEKDNQKAFPSSGIFVPISRRRNHGFGPNGAPNNFRPLNFVGSMVLNRILAISFDPTKKWVVEVDGDVHAERRVQKKDRERGRFFQSLDLRVIRYNNDDVLNNLDGVLADLLVQLS